MTAKKPKSPTELTLIRPKNDMRVNIPTEELRDFVADEEKAPRAMLYPRDPLLDPQLVWKGKDEQDQAALEVPVVPIYIQEKVHPQALVENLRDTAKAGDLEPELTLFDDFNGMDDAGFDKKVDFYHHDHHWSNRMLLGDSLLVMTSLAEKEGLKGKVQTIYFDPSMPAVPDCGGEIAGEAGASRVAAESDEFVAMLTVSVRRLQTESDPRDRAQS